MCRWERLEKEVVEIHHRERSMEQREQSWACICALDDHKRQPSCTAWISCNGVMVLTASDFIYFAQLTFGSVLDTYKDCPQHVLGLDCTKAELAVTASFMLEK
jgi:hypothetical protein